MRQGEALRTETDGKWGEPRHPGVCYVWMLSGFIFTRGSVKSGWGIFHNCTYSSSQISYTSISNRFAREKEMGRKRGAGGLEI